MESDINYKTISLRIDPNLDRRLRQAAAERDLSRSEFIRQALAEKLQEEDDYYFHLGVELWIEDARLRQLVRRVWDRLPAYDRHLLHERILEISDKGSQQDHVLGSVAVPDPIGLLNGCPAQIAENILYCVSLAGTRRVTSDLACMFVIAHEFAHAVLRHPEMSLVVVSLLGFEPEPIYTDDDLDDLKTWHDEEANLLAWLWGFRDEFEAFLNEHPEATRPRWYVEAQVGPMSGQDIEG